VNSVESKLDRHLLKIRNILNDSKSFMKSVENYHLIGRSISIKNAAIRYSGIIIMMKKNEQNRNTVKLGYNEPLGTRIVCSL
jgi:hypothetical protein